MKRVGFLYENLYSPDNIRLAIKKSSKGKHKNRSVRKVLANVDFYVDEIKTMLESGDIKWGKDHYKQVKEFTGIDYVKTLKDKPDVFIVFTDGYFESEIKGFDKTNINTVFAIRKEELLPHSRKGEYSSAHNIPKL